MIRLIATDLDGTLVRSDQTISDRSHAALQAARAAGIKVVLITGRPMRWAQHVSDVVDADAVAVANGAVVFDGELQEVLLSQLLDPQHASAYAAAIRAHDPEVVFACERMDGFCKESVYRERWPAPDNRTVEMPDLLSEPMVKMLVRHEGMDADQLLAMGRSVALGHEVSLTHSSTEGLLEISALGVDKATALQHIAQMWEVSAEDVVAFGDMPNDAAMLAWAGQSYAVANAHPAAAAAAKARTTSNDDDGVAVVIEALTSRGMRSAPRRG